MNSYDTFKEMRGSFAVKKPGKILLMPMSGTKQIIDWANKGRVCEVNNSERWLNTWDDLFVLMKETLEEN